jgi:hypothetical protein
MSVLVIGGDDIISIKAVLSNLGAEKITHWDGEKNLKTKAKSIPDGTDYLLMMTDFINQDMMKKYKKLAKKGGISIICTRRSVSCVYGEFCRALGKDVGCQFN